MADFQESFEHIKRLGEQLANSPKLRALQDLTESLAANMASISDAIPTQFGDPETWSEIADHWTEVSEKEAAGFRRRAWPPPLQMGLQEYGQLVLAASDDSVTDPEFDAMMASSLRGAYLESVMRRWLALDVLATRAEILNDVIEAARGGLWAVVIPTLLAQSEGVIVETLGVARFNAQNHVPKLVQRGLMADLIRDQLTELHSTTSLRADDSYPFRNPILHGDSTTYGTEVNGLKAVLLFDLVVDEASSRSRDQGAC